LPPDQTLRPGDPFKLQVSFVVDGVLMGYNPLISNEEEVFKRCPISGGDHFVGFF
jgi:hypothetical protein